VQAPQKRSQPRQHEASDRRTWWLLGLAGAGIVGLIVAGVVVLGSGGSGTPSTGKLGDLVRAVGGSFQEVGAGASQRHMTRANETVRYATFPPVSGIHNPVPALWGDYRTAADPRQVVHNLEHGGVVVWYGSRLPAEERAKITAWYDKSPNGIVVTPIEDKRRYVIYPAHDAMGSKVALTAWGGNGKGYVAILPRFDEKAFDAFRNALRGRGPEPFPVNQLLPGTIAGQMG
jgi:hypothetical protein